MRERIQGVNSKVTAKLIGEVIEEFFKPLSYKSLIFMSVFFCGIIIINE